MATHLVNVAPAPEATGMLIEEYYRFSFRDDTSRVDRGSVLVQAVYSRAHYEGGPELPEGDASLFAAGGRAFVGAFSDAGGTGVPASAAVSRTPGEPLVLSRAQNGAHRGAQFLTATPVKPPYAMEVEILPLSWTLGATAYLNDARYAGICFGAIFGPSKTGIFGFLLDDGGTKKVLLSGADDGTGSRPGSVEYELDWALGFVYKIVWDPIRDLGDVYVRISSDPNALATLVHSFTLSALLPFIDGVAFGPVPFGPSAGDNDLLWGFLNLDSPTISDSVSSEFLRLFEYGRNLMVGGVLGSGTVMDLRSSDLLAAEFSRSPDKALLPWTAVLGDGSISVNAAATQITKSVADATGLQRVMLQRDEPALDLSQGVMLYTRFSAVVEAHPGSVGTGMGFAFDDGTDRLLLMLLDDFATYQMGVYQVGDSVQLSSYATSLEVDWSSEVGIKMFVNVALDTISVYAMGNDDLPLLTGSLTTMSSASLGTPRVEVGHVDVYATRPVFGTMSLLEYQYGLEVTEYASVQGVVPSLATPTWTEVISGAGVGSSAMSGGLFRLEDADYGMGADQGRRFERYAIPIFGSTVGVTVEGRFQVVSWSNQAGNPAILEPVSSGIAIDDGTEVVHIAFVETLYGRFAYLPGFDQEQSLLDVIAQNVAGQAISTQVDFLLMHTYRLEKKPEGYIRLYIDDAKVPAVTLPWTIAQGFDLPATLGAGGGVLFGSLDTSRKSISLWRRCVFSVGNGYDLAIRPLFTESERTNVFGAISEIILQAEGV